MAKKKIIKKADRPVTVEAEALNSPPLKLTEIQELIKFVAKAGVSEVDLSIKDFRVVIKTGGKHETVFTAVPQAIAPIAAVPPVVHATPAIQQPETKAPEVKKEGIPVASDESKYLTIKSPMIGTFYRSPGPDKPVFVNIGDEITSGKVICIIEAMKLFNEIESDIKGKIVKVLVNDASPVEYDQPLFLVDPS